MPWAGVEEIYTHFPGKGDEIPTSDPQGISVIRVSDSFSGVGCQTKHHAAPLLQMDLGHREVSQEVMGYCLE